MNPDPEKNKERENAAEVPDDLLPGERKLKKTVKAIARRLPGSSSLKDDINAGLTGAMNRIPDGMANGLLAGVSPIMGLFAAVCGSIVGGVFNSSRLMVISTTGASAFLVYQLTQAYPEEQRADALLLLVMLSGILMILMGFMKLGNLVRFVSYSVMIGFLAGISILVILSQLPTVFDIPAEGSNKIMETVNLFQNIHLTNWHALVAGVATLLFMLLLPRTPLGNKSAIVAIALPSLFIFFMNWNDVEVVRDLGEIPSGLPTLRLPNLALLQPDLFSGALSLALIILIQAAGVSQSVPNPDGSRSDTSKDFISQGIANMSSGLIGGIAVGGSLGATSINIVSGARSRWASVFSGLLVLTLVLLLPGLVGQVAMPVLAAVMIFAMASSLKMEENRQIWNAGWAARIGFVFTFLVTLVMPVQYAVLIGVLLSFILYFFTSSRLVKLHRRQLLSDGRFEEISLPAEIEKEAVHIFAVEGDLHFAGARMLANQWPKLDPQTRHPVIILELRGRNNIGATLTEVIETFYEKVKKAEGRFYITELGENSYAAFLTQADTVVLRGIRMKKKESIVGKSTLEAVLEAKEWLEKGAPAEEAYT